MTRSEVWKDLMEPLLAILSQFPDPNIRALAKGSGLASHPDDRPNNFSPTGQEIVYASFVGWPNVEAHQASTGTEEVKMIAFADSRPGLGTPHASCIQGLTLNGLSNQIWPQLWLVCSRQPALYLPNPTQSMLGKSQDSLWQTAVGLNNGSVTRSVEQKCQQSTCH